MQGDVFDVLVDACRRRRRVLLLNNFEQILAAATAIDALLEFCPELSILATSREPLRLRREQIYVVPPLELEQAIELFVERARAVQPGFRVHPGNERAIAELCRRLDCLPLPVELAAARTSLLDPEDIAAHLADRLVLLRGGPRDAPERQRGLEATLAWSHDLRLPSEQALASPS